jgi:hypothetical protein
MTKRRAAHEARGKVYDGEGGESSAPVSASGTGTAHIAR